METKGYSFPSLLYTEKPVGIDIDGQVFRDLKLAGTPEGEEYDALTEVMSRLPSRSDIEKRRELFDCLRKMRRKAGGDFTKDPFGALGFALWEVKNYDAAFSRRTDGARAVIFACLCGLFCDFCLLAAELKGKGSLLSDFSEFFRSYRNKEGYSEFESEAAKLRRSLPEAFFSVKYRTGGDLSPEEPENEGFVSRITDRLSDEPEEGEELPPEYELIPDERPSDAFAEKLVSLYPEALKEARGFYEKYRDFYDPSIVEYDKEFDFIHCVLKIEEAAEQAGIPLCVPTLTDRRVISAKNAYDVTLLLSKGERDIVPNDIELSEKQPLFFLSGANGGGKTTYLRALGVNVLLALSGAKAAADSFEIGPVDGVFTHFPQFEQHFGAGRFESEKIRAFQTLDKLGKTPLVLLNETFSTTNEQKSRRAIEDYAKSLLSRGALGVYVTHTSDINVPGVGSLVCEIDDNNPGKRTYRIIKADNTRGAHAADLIEKYGLTPASLRKLFSERRSERE